ncbi:MAG: hypothetical protein V1709_06335 [Planctomycetota bacterium]
MSKKYIAILILLLSVGISFIYAQSEGKDESKDRLSPDDIQRNMKSYKSTVEKIRGRKFKSDVPFQIQSAKEFKEFIAQEWDKSMKDKGQLVQSALIKLGLLPKNYDLKKGFEGLLAGQAAAYYNPETKSMYLLKTDYPPQEVDTIMIHELSHALQDQYCDLTKFNNPTDDDKDAALKYLIEGEATYIMTIGGLERMGISFTPDSPVLELTFNRMKLMGRRELLQLNMASAELYKKLSPDIAESLKNLNNVPSYLFWVLQAPYLHGAYAVHNLVTLDEKQKNWRVIDGLYENIPVSTEQMIHPDKLIEPRDDPATIPRPSLTEDWMVLYENTLGELGFWILYSQYAKNDARQASEGWGGDKYFLIRNNKTNDTILCLSTVWDSEEDAYESYKAYQKVINKKYSTVEIQKIEKDNNGAEKIVYITGNNKIILTLKNNKWTAIEGIPAEMDWK